MAKVPEVCSSGLVKITLKHQVHMIPRNNAPNGSQETASLGPIDAKLQPPLSSHAAIYPLPQFLTWFINFCIAFELNFLSIKILWRVKNENERGSEIINYLKFNWKIMDVGSSRHRTLCLRRSDAVQCGVMLDDTSTHTDKRWFFIKRVNFTPNYFFIRNRCYELNFKLFMRNI